MYISYTHANDHIKCAIVDPIPDPNTYYLFPRSDKNRSLTNKDPAQIQCRVEAIHAGGQDRLRFYGNGSAGVDMDIVDPCFDTITIVIPIFLESIAPDTILRILSVGDGQIQLGLNSQAPNRFHICIDNTWRDAGPFNPAVWNTIVITINKTAIVTYNQSDYAVHPPASAFSGRVYLGDGYPSDFLDENSRFQIDVQRFTTRVTPTTPAGACGDPNHLFPPQDLNYDCRCDYDDFNQLVEYWLK
jgi:hypothetical protein